MFGRSEKSATMTERKCDLLVVGGGPGGYSAAIRAAQKGLRTVLVEKDRLGGTCLNRGCIPTKALLDDSRMVYSLRRSPFISGRMTASLERLMERKGMVVEGSREGIRNVLLGSGVTLMAGAAAFSGPKSVTVRDSEGGEGRITAAHIILATGAAPDYGPGLAVDGRSVLSTDQALNIETIPQALVVVGAGARGVEFASIYHQLGARVALVEKKKRILSAFDQTLADRYKKALLDRRIKVLTRTELVETHPREGGGVLLVMASGEEKQEIKADLVILTGERRPVYRDLNLGRAGLAPVEGVLEADADMRTKADGVYVVGDAAGPPYLAHKAIAQGLGAVDHILGRPGRKRPLAVPFCLYGSPEAASVGLSEEEAEDSGRRVKVGEYLFAGNGRAGALGDLEGGVTIVSDADTGQVLGVQMLGPGSTELISLASLAMQNGVDVAGIKQTVFPHPGLAESFFEAALATDGEAVHMLLGGA